MFITLFLSYVSAELYLMRKRLKKNPRDTHMKLDNDQKATKMSAPNLFLNHKNSRILIHEIGTLNS